MTSSDQTNALSKKSLGVTGWIAILVGIVALGISITAILLSLTNGKNHTLPQNGSSMPYASQACPDIGSVGAHQSGDTNMRVAVIDSRQSFETVRLLGPDRRVVIAKNAVMYGSVTVCGQNGTVLIVGKMNGAVFMRGGGKIVVQDDAELPTAYSTDGQVFRCTTNHVDQSMPHCADFTPQQKPDTEG